MVAVVEIDSDSSSGDSSPRSIPLPVTSTQLSTPSLSQLPAADQSRASEGSSLLGDGTPPPRQIPLTRFTPTGKIWRQRLSTASPSASRPALSVVPTSNESQEKKLPMDQEKPASPERLPEGRILSLLRSKSKMGNFHNVTVNKEAVPQLARPSTNAAPEFISVNQSARVRSEPSGNEANAAGGRSEINLGELMHEELTPYEVFTKNRTYTSSVKDLLRGDDVDQKDNKLNSGFKKIGEMLNEELSARRTKAVSEKSSPTKHGGKLPSKVRASSQDTGTAVTKKRSFYVALSQGRLNANDKSPNKSPKVPKNSKLQVSPRITSASPTVTPAENTVNGVIINDSKGKPSPSSKSSGSPLPLISRKSVPAVEQVTASVASREKDDTIRSNTNGQTPVSQNEGRLSSITPEKNLLAVQKHPSVTPVKKTVDEDGKGISPNRPAPATQSKSSPPSVKSRDSLPAGSKSVTPAKRSVTEANIEDNEGKTVSISLSEGAPPTTISRDNLAAGSQSVTPAEKNLTEVNAKEYKSRPVATSQDVLPVKKTISEASAKDDKEEPVTTSQSVTPAKKSLPGASAKENNDKPVTTIQSAGETAKPVPTSEGARKSPPIIFKANLAIGGQSTTPAKKSLAQDLAQVDTEVNKGKPVETSESTRGPLPVISRDSLAAEGQSVAPAKKSSPEENDKGNNREPVPTNKSIRSPSPIISKHSLAAAENKSVPSVTNNEKEDTASNDTNGETPSSHTERNPLQIVPSESGLSAQKVSDVVAHENGNGRQEMNGNSSVDQDKRQTNKENYVSHPPRSAIQRTGQDTANARPLASMEVKWNDALAQEPPDSSTHRQALADLFARLYQKNMLIEPEVAKPKSAHSVNENSKQTGLIEARIVTDPELFGIEETNSKRPIVKLRDKPHHLKGAVVVNYAGSPKIPTDKPVEEDKSASRVELHYLTDSEGTSSDNEERVQKASAGLGLKGLEENASSLQRPVSHATLHENSTDGLPTSAASPFQHQDPQVERRRIDRELTVTAMAALGRKVSFKKGLLMHLVEPGIAKHSAMALHPKVSVTNNICSADNYEHSHAYYYQQLHKRSKLEFIPLRGTQSTDSDERKNRQVLPKATTILETSKVPPEATTISETSKVPPEATTISETSKVPPEATTISAASKVPPEATTISETSKLPPEPTTISETSKQKEQPKNRPGEVWKRNWRLLLQRSSILFDLCTSSKTRKRDSEQIAQLQRIFKVEFGAQIATQFDGKVEIVISSGGSIAAKTIENILKDKEKARTLSKNMRLWSIEKAYQFLENMGIDVRDWTTTQENVTTISTSKAPVKQVKTNVETRASARAAQAGTVRATDAKSPPVEVTIEKPLPKAFVVEAPASKSITTVGPETKTTPEPEMMAKTMNVVKEKPKNTTAVVDNEPNKIRMKKPEVTDTDVAVTDTESESDELEEDLESIMQTASEALEKKDKQIKAARKLILALCQDAMKKELEITSLTGQLKAAQRQLNEKEKSIQDYATTLVQKELQLRNLTSDQERPTSGPLRPASSGHDLSSI